MITRYSKNPVLTKQDVPFKVNSIFNPGAVKFKNEYILLCRVEMPTGRSSFVLAKSKDGYNFKVESKPCLTPEDHKEFYEFVEWGIEDPRITQMGDKFFITYTGFSKYLPLVMLAETEDFYHYKIHGPISEPSNKDCAVFPEKINGMFWKMDRPSNDTINYIWLNSSNDLVHWGNYKALAEPEKGTWEADKIGGSTPPVKTDEGWLFLYHGVRGFGISNLYKIGVMLLDLNEPWKIAGKSVEPILSPEEDYERVGDVGNVVFTNGWIIEGNGDVKIYYSGADSNVCIAETSMDYLLSLCKNGKSLVSVNFNGK
ncbi:MAG: glycoside hydrolase family 130 protein [Ignavibacteriaceae bacterium]